MAFKCKQKRIKWSPFESTRCRCRPYQKLALKMKAAKKFQFYMMRRNGIPDYFARRRTPERVMYPTLLQSSMECVAASRPARQPASQPASQPTPTKKQPGPDGHPRPGRQPGGSLPAASHESPRIHLARTRGAAATYTYSL